VRCFVGIEVAHDPQTDHVADVAVGRALGLDPAAQLPEGLIRGRRQREVGKCIPGSFRLGCFLA
jgi:hypothetical protein